MRFDELDAGNESAPPDDPLGAKAPAIRWHVGKTGSRFAVELRSRPARIGERAVLVVLARDLSPQPLRPEAEPGPSADDHSGHPETEPPAPLFRALFEAVPENILVLTSGRLEIVAASDAYLRLTGRKREELIGVPVFEAFPDDPSESQAQNAQTLRASFERAVRSRRPDVMPVERYPVARPDAPGEAFADRYWSIVNTPVLDARGDVAWIFNQVEDVTELVAQNAVTVGVVAPHASDTPANAVLQQAQRLRRENTRLVSEIEELRLATRILKLAVWAVDLDRRALVLTPELHAFFGTDPARFDGSLAGYLDLVHPEDRARVQSEFAGFEHGPAPVLRTQHRVIRPADGRLISVAAAGERAMQAGRPLVRGIVQVISERVEAEAALDRATYLNRTAGHAAGLGGWYWDAASRQLTWTEESFAVLELTAGTPPPITELIGYYVPQARPRIRAAFRRCLRHGIPFDEVVQVVTARGRELWVRVIGDPVRDPRGRITGIEGAFQDVDDLVRTRERATAFSRHLTRTLENISDGFFTLDRNWTFGFVNTRAGQMLRRDPRELVGRNIWTEFPEAAGLTFPSAYERVVRTGETVRFEEVFPPLDAWFQVNAYPAPDGVAVYFRDISEERRREAQLRLLEAAVAQQKEILEITGAETDAPDDPRFVYVNPAFERATGYSPEEVLGKTPRMLQGPQTDRRDLDRIRAAVQKGEGVAAEIVNYRKDGSPFWLAIDIRPLRNHDGQITNFIATGRDVTERRQAEDALRASEERFRLIARAASEVIWDWDVLGGSTRWSDGMAAVFGHPIDVEGPPPGHWERTIHPDEAEEVIAGLQQAIDSGAPEWTARYRFRRGDGSWATVDDRAFIIRNREGAAVRVLGAMTDVTEKLQLEAQLRQAQKLEAIGQLTGGVAHDFNNLLTVILGNAELMTDALGHEPRLRAMAEMMASAALRGAELTNRLLAFARRQVLKPETVDLNRLVTDLEGLLRRTLSEEIDIKFAQSPDLWPVEIDPGQLEAALLNLVINARDAMPGGGQLTIETGNVRLDEEHPATQFDLPAGQYVRVAVSDTGIGMPPTVRDRVFEPFFTTKEAGKGSGLGLPMVYGFASSRAAMSGSIPSRARARRSSSTSRAAARRPLPPARRRPPRKSRAGGNIFWWSRTTIWCASMSWPCFWRWATACPRPPTGPPRSRSCAPGPTSTCSSPMW